MEIDPLADVARADEAPRVDLNRASLEELCALPGIGPALAQRILDYRAAQGAFPTSEALQDVPGIGATLYTQLAPSLTALPLEPAVEAIPLPDAFSLELPPLAEPLPPPTSQPLAPVSPMPTPPTVIVRNMGFWPWLWAVLTGAVLGLVFSLLVFAGINGSLDIAHSPALREARAQNEALTTQLTSLQAEARGLRQRLDALEGLTARMNRTETAVSTLRAETESLASNLATLETHLTAINTQLETVQQQQTRVNSFFAGLQTLLRDTFTEQPDVLPGD